MGRILTSLSALSIALVSCSPNEPWTQGGHDVAIVEAYAQTPPVGSAEDAADDPAVWVHPNDPSRSLVLGTDKKSGLHVYDLNGKDVQFLQVGNLNNVDVRTINIPGGTRSIAAATNRTNQSITVFEIAETGKVTVLGDIPLPTEPYGLCLGSFSDGQINPVVTYKDGAVTLHAWDGMQDLASTAQIGRWKLETQLEGCAVDEANDAIFIGEEAFGVWRIVHNKGEEVSRSAVDRIADGNGLVEDVEGLDLWRGEAGDGYLVVSAQSADRFVLYDRMPPHQKRGIVHVGPSSDGAIDSVSHTDGLTVSSAFLGDAHSKGILVVQDDHNTDPDAAQNFKLVDWADIEAALGL